MVYNTSSNIMSMLANMRKTFIDLIKHLSTLFFDFFNNIFVIIKAVIEQIPMVLQSIRKLVTSLVIVAALVAVIGVGLGTWILGKDQIVEIIEEKVGKEERKLELALEQEGEQEESEIKEEGPIYVPN